MTKHEERQVLKKIQALIESTGEDSYISMAFKGCCDMARSNIENDFGDSMQEWAQREQARAADIQAELQATKKAMTKARDLAQQKDEELAEAIRAHRQEVRSLKAAILPADLYKALWVSVDTSGAEASRRIEEIAETLAEYAGHPKDIAVSHNLLCLKQEIAKRSEAEALLKALEKYEPKEA